MKLQFAFGNPRKKRKKSVAKRSKSKKNRVKSKLKKAVKHMAKRKGRKVRKGRKGHRRTRKNPEGAAISRGGKRLGTEHSPLSGREAAAAEGKFISLMKKYKAAPQASDRSALMREMAALKKKLGKRASFLKVLERYAETPGTKITKYDLKEKGAKVAKKRKSKKRKHAKKAKASKKRHTKRRTKRKGAKRGKRRMSKKAKRAFVARMKKARKGKGGKKRHAKKRHAKKRASKRRGKRRSRRSKMITHKHAKSTRHIRRGSKARVSARKKKGSYKIKTHFGRGKRRVRMTGTLRQSKSGLKGIFRLNPFRRNPMTDALKKFTGLDNKELQVLAIGAAAAPLSAALLPKIPGINIITSYVAKAVPVKYQSAVMNILLGAFANYLSTLPALKQGQKPLAMIGEGLAAASIIGMVSSLVTDGLKMTGMAGINYSPSMRGLGIMPQLNGVNYTPSMRGMGDVRYTPQMRGLGSSADFGSTDYGGGGGYTEAHNRSRADFGANFSSDSEAEGLDDQDNSYSSSMN